MVTDFSAAEKVSGVKLRTLVRLLSGMSFSHFGELWPGAAAQEAYEGAVQIAPGKKFAFSLERLDGQSAPYGGICVLLAHLLCTFQQ